ncbi:MAG: glutamine-hydrolyzing GMP synthase, partial [Chloroflexi bacterium]|nr:glutamine-hydrolyzing GMP synthase [Chloroflexota bacterium]
MPSIVVLDFGSQYAQLIVRRVRELHVYCELLPHDAPRAEIERLSPRGFILSGGPASVYDAGAPPLPPYVLDAGVPVFGVCYGMQLLAHALHGDVRPSTKREYGAAQVSVRQPDALFRDVPPQLHVWMSHGDAIERAPDGFAVLAQSPNTPIAAMGDAARRVYGVQFHPEVTHTEHGLDLLRNFVLNVCGCTPDWLPENIIEQSVARIREQVGDERVLCALSGGVD